MPGKKSLFQEKVSGKKYSVTIIPVSYTHLDVYKRQAAKLFSVVRNNGDPPSTGPITLWLLQWVPLHKKSAGIFNSFFNKSRASKFSESSSSLSAFVTILAMSAPRPACASAIFKTSPRAVSYTHLDVYKRQVTALLRI